MASRWFQVSVIGAKSYVAANQLRSGGRKRTERCIAKVRHLYRDLDTDCDTPLTSLRASEALLPPTVAISTSPGKYQVRWRIDCSPFERQESSLKLLCIAFGRDPVCTNVSRIHRPPGYLSCKYDTTNSITVEYQSDSVWNCDDFRLDILAAEAILSSRAITARKQLADHSNREHDWAWVLHELALAKTPRSSRASWLRAAPINRILYYAQRTVDVASARLWLVEGVPIDDVVTLLEGRRRFEIPVALCRASAREIAHTAQRMIAQKKIA